MCAHKNVRDTPETVPEPVGLEEQRARSSADRGVWPSADRGEYILSAALAKFIGLYYVVSADGDGGGGRAGQGWTRYLARMVFVSLVVITATCLSLCPLGVYHWSNDTTQFILQFVIFGNFSFGCFKMYRLFKHADNVRACLDITRIGFVRFGDDDDDGMLRMRRVQSYRFARWFAMCNYCILLMWSSLPFLVGSEQRVLVRNLDGSIDSYRCNPFNMYFAVSVDTYNRWHSVFHLLEFLVGLCFVFSMVMFDTFMVTLCIAITGQLNMVATAYEKFAHNHVNGCFRYGDRELNTSKKNLDDLKLIITHHQAVLRKMHDYYRIVRPVILPQLIVASFTVISLSYIITLNYTKGMLWISIQSLKFCAFPTFVCQLYYTCFVFGNLNHQKNEMNFALYSCNWTQMNIKFKKLLLLAMQVHTSNGLNMKLTAKLIINLEMFANVMNLCYSIFSVLVNSQLKLTEKL